MAEFADNSLDQSVMNTSALHDGDLDMFHDVMEELCNKQTDFPSKMSRSNAMRKMRTRANPSKRNRSVALNRSTAFEHHERPDTCRWSSSCHSLNDFGNTTSSSINQSIEESNVSCISEQFNDILAYFSEDVDQTLFECSESEDDETPISMREKKFSPSHKSKHGKAKELQTKSRSLMDTIKSQSESDQERSFKRPPPFSIVLKKTSPKKQIGTTERMNRTLGDFSVNRPKNFSSASTLSLHESDSDTNRNGNDVESVPTKVRDRISFFNQTIGAHFRSASPTSATGSSTETTSSRTESPIATSDDEERILERQKSKRKFQQNRDFFEKWLHEQTQKKDREAAKTKTSFATAKKLPQKTADDKTIVTANTNSNQINGIDKLNAVRTYVQTMYLLERIQSLVKAITRLDEQRLAKMNLKLLKKFLIFIRDCSNQCQTVCFEIGENFLTDFERNVLTADELLISAMKNAHLHEVFCTLA